MYKLGFGRALLVLTIVAAIAGCGEQRSEGFKDPDNAVPDVPKVPAGSDKRAVLKQEILRLQGERDYLAQLAEDYDRSIYDAQKEHDYWEREQIKGNYSTSVTLGLQQATAARLDAIYDKRETLNKIREIDKRIREIRNQLQ